MKVAISSRWQPTHLTIRDPDNGIYIDRNPPIASDTELRVQKALLLVAPPKLRERIKAVQALRGEHWPGHYPDMGGACIGPDCSEQEQYEQN